jgi:hypothetical protein
MNYRKRPMLNDYIGEQVYVQFRDGHSSIGMLRKEKKLFILHTRDGDIFFHTSDCKKCRKPIDWSKI